MHQVGDIQLRPLHEKSLDSAGKWAIRVINNFISPDDSLQRERVKLGEEVKKGFGKEITPEVNREMQTSRNGNSSEVAE